MAPSKSKEPTPAIQIVSDLHLEAHSAYTFYQIPPAPGASYLALLGDIGNVTNNHMGGFTTFLTTQLKNFPGGVLFVPGNHEAYGSDYPAAIQALTNITTNSQPPKRLIVLDRAEFRPPESPGTFIIGCSLFSHVPEQHRKAVSLGLNDFYHINNWTVNNHNAAHARDLGWLNNKVAELDSQDDVKKIIIFTHWTPSTDPRAGDPKHAGSPISCAFATDLSREPCFLSPKVKLWAFGHTHFNCDFQAERPGAEPLRLLANQRGYYHQQSDGYDIMKTVDL